MDDNSDIENNEPIILNENDTEIKVESNNKKIKLKKSKKVMSECGVPVEIRYRTKQDRPKPIVVYYEDLEIENPTPKVVVKKKRARGRPKKNPIVQYVDDDGVEVEDKMDASQTIINAPKNEKYTEKDLQLLQLQEKILQLEAVSGKKIRATKKGKVDGRQTRPPTEKQLEARKKFVEANKARNAKRRADKEAKSQLQNKESVKEVINELAELKKQSVQKQQEEEALKQKILADEKAKLEQEKENNKFGIYSNDDLFK